MARINNDLLLKQFPVVQYDLPKKVLNYRELYVSGSQYRRGVLFFQFYADRKVTFQRLPDPCPLLSFKQNSSGIRVELIGVNSELNEHEVDAGTAAFCVKPLLLYDFKGITQNIASLVNTPDQNDYKVDQLELAKRIFSTDDIAKRMQIFNLATSVHNYSLNNAYLVANYCADMIQSNYQDDIRISVMLDQTNYSREYCRVSFKNIYGVSPKKYYKLIRLHRALSLLKNVSDGKCLPDIAIQSGYYDQAHFTNEFRGFLGRTPQEVYKEIGKSHFEL